MSAGGAGVLGLGAGDEGGAEGGAGDSARAREAVQGFQELVSPVSDFMYMVGSIPRYSNFQNLLMSIFLMFLLV